MHKHGGDDSPTPSKLDEGDHSNATRDSGTKQLAVGRSPRSRVKNHVLVAALALSGFTLSNTHRAASRNIPSRSGLSVLVTTGVQALVAHGMFTWERQRREYKIHLQSDQRLLVSVQALLHVCAIALASQASRTAGVALHQAVVATAGVVLAQLLDGKFNQYAAAAATIAAAVALNTNEMPHASRDAALGTAYSLGQAAAFAAVGALHRHKRLRQLPRTVVVANLTASAAACVGLYVALVVLPRWEEWVDEPLRSLKWTRTTAFALILSNGVIAAAHANLSAAVARSGAASTGISMANAVKTCAVVLHAAAARI